MKTSCGNNKCSKCSSYTIPGFPCVECYAGSGCEVVYSTDCVIYQNTDLECYGINFGDNLTKIILVLLEYVFPECNEIQ
jgi:hypothetical protein